MTYFESKHMFTIEADGPLKPNHQSRDLIKIYGNDAEFDFPFPKDKEVYALAALAAIAVFGALYAFIKACRSASNACRRKRAAQTRSNCIHVKISVEVEVVEVEAKRKKVGAPRGRNKLCKTTGMPRTRCSCGKERCGGSLCKSTGKLRQSCRCPDEKCGYQLLQGYG